MSEFDPYRKWLGIRPEEQPPHHYRLLGIPLYEDDLDVIDAAVEQRVAFLQNCAGGEHLKLSQKILNEVADARNVLCDQKKKAAYDASLKAARKTDSSPAEGSPQDVEHGTVQRKPVLTDQNSTGLENAAESGLPVFTQPVATSGPQLTVSGRQRRRRRRSSGLISAAVFGMAATAGLIWWLFKGTGAEQIDEFGRNSEGKPVAADTTSTDSTDSSSPEAKHTGDNANAQTQSPMEVSEPDPTSQAATSVKPATGAETLFAPLRPDIAAGPAGELPDATRASPLLVSSPSVKRLPAPGATDLQTALDDLRLRFAESYADPKSRPALITQLIQLAKDATDQPAIQCAAWSEAASLAAVSGDATVAFLTLDRLTGRFDGSFFELKEEVFLGLQRKREMSIAPQLVVFGFELVDDLIDADQYEAAATALGRVRNVSVRIKDTRLLELADYLKTRIRTLGRGFNGILSQAMALRKNPDDDAAAAAVGRFRSFIAEDWDRGLPLLSRSEDITLSLLATQDLAAPQSADEQVTLADAWWSYSSGLPVGERDAVRRRAGVWYVSALQELEPIRRTEVLATEQRVPSEKAAIAIAAKVSAADTLTIRRDGATWRPAGKSPTDVHINGLLWNVAEDRVQRNHGVSRMLPHGVHFGRVRLTKIQGPAGVRMTVSGEEIVIVFRPGGGVFQLLLSFE